jgi:hypothetical protein
MMTPVSAFDSDTRTGTWRDEEGTSTGSTRTSAGTVMFRHSVRSLLSCAGSPRAALRNVVKEALLAAREPFSRIDELLATCTSVASTDRLDMAVDVLAETGHLVWRYAWDFLVRDVQQWNPYSDRAYEPNDDHWYILLRAVARCNAPDDARLRFILACSGASRRGILEGVVEALGDLEMEEAASKLREMADAHEDAFIRKLASDVLDDME